MNYSHDTDMDLGWAADQLRREQNQRKGLPDSPIRRQTCVMPQVTASGPGPLEPLTLLSPRQSTIGSALSALEINADCSAQCLLVCEGLLAFFADRSSPHAEFVELKGIDALLGILKRHGGSTALAALRLLEKLSRTASKDICAAGGVEILARCCEKAGQAPRIVEAALRALHGLTFSQEARAVVSRRGVAAIAEAFIELRGTLAEREVGASQGEERDVEMAWEDVLIISHRLLARLASETRRPVRPKWSTRMVS